MIDYIQEPHVKISTKSSALKTYKDICASLKQVTLIEIYPGVRVNEIVDNLKKNKYDGEIVLTSEFSPHTKTSFRKAIFDDLTNDRVFGRMTDKNYQAFFDEEKIKQFVNKNTGKKLVIIGICAHLFNFKNATLIYADMPRWEIQQRYRAGEGVYFKGDLEKETLKNFKRGYFIEWRMADKIKKQVWNKIDLFLDTTCANKPILIESSVIKSAIESTSKRPFRLVPYFDAGVWGGDWMKRKLGLGDNKYSKWAWGFDGVPEENSIKFEFTDKTTFEIPAINVVFFQSKNLLGPRVWNRFGEEFPIRFDFLDTINGQNLSLQVHPTTQYIRDQFKMNYTQEESYYILDVEGKNSTCYLGLKNGINLDEFFGALNQAQKTNKMDVEKYVNRFSVKKHDHLLHPAGCIHSSASGCMVLEISATPYIFTFKLWDWERVDFDGKPRPINIEHGKHVVQSEFNTTKCVEECVSNFKTIKDNGKVKIEKTGLHETQFIETIRYSVNQKSGVTIDCYNSVNMLNLVEGTNVIVEPINNKFEPIVIHYAETFIVPEWCKEYRVRSLDNKPFKVLQAFVRTNGIA